MSLALLRHDNPYLAFAKAVEIFFDSPALPPSIHPTAWIADTAVIGQNVHIGPLSYVGERVVLVVSGVHAFRLHHEGGTRHAD